MKNARWFFIRAALFAAACSALFAAYTYYLTDTLTSINTTNWTQNGTLTAGSGGLTSSNANGGSLISKVAVPDGTSDYEVRTTLTLAQSGGTYVTYLRASSNALSGPAVAGTAYAFEVQNPTFSGSACTATLASYKIISGSVTTLSSTTIPCSNGMIIRAIYTAQANQIAVYVNNVIYFVAQDSSITSGKPGIGVRGAPAGNSIAEVQLGGIYNGALAMPPAGEIGVSAFANRVEIQWPGANDGANGPGVAWYELFRNSTFIGSISTESFVDATVSPSTTYTYWVQAIDYDLNANLVSFTVATPPTGAIDAREIGVRPTGSYWGGGGEQIDMRSGNLNYTTPILKAMGRGGWSVGFNLTYNSQNWRQDAGGTWQLGEDVGYGYGWKLLAGSLLPIVAPSGTVAEYLFTDATGAQYHLNQNSAGVWTSIESIYVAYDANAGKLHFNDGSFWVLGCTSAGTEWDAGTMYPTVMEDSNGNQVFINYNDGVNVTWANSSSRINTIEDVRGYGGRDYAFSYNGDPIPHLLNVVNYIGTAENYSFGYTPGYALTSPSTSPFTGQAFGSVTLLKSSTVTGIPLTSYFTYDTASPTTSCSSPGTGTSGPGELTQVTTPYCGYLRWTYTTANTLSGSRTYNEVQKRFLLMSPTATESEIDLNRGSDTLYSVHSSATLDDTPSNSEKYWSFRTDTTQFDGGLQLTYEERTLSSHVPLSHLDFTWAQTPNGTSNPYIGTTVTKLDPTQATYTQWKQTTQTLDQYGNLLTMKAYNFGNGVVGSLARTYTNTYLGGTNYTSRYIFNRLLTSTVTDGTNTATLVSNTYDATGFTNLTIPCLSVGGLCEHDNANYPSTFTYRGDVTSSTTPTTISTNSYDMTGNSTGTRVNGVTSTVTAANNYAAPGQVTTNTLTSTMNWTPALGLSSAEGPNGDTGSIGYDADSRPSTVTSPYGAITKYTYNDAASTPNKLAMTNGHGVQTYMDGFGRTTQTVTGYGTTTISTVVSTVDAKYLPCGCSPLGKLSQQSQPYAPGGTDAWTTYSYDASGRTLKVTLPDNSYTQYQYSGNTVTVTDPALKWKTFTMDALGNLVSVVESDPSLGNVTTSYTYDVMNHLISVSMPRGTNTQTRTFNYSSGTTVTGFLQSATNPENGTVSYTYNPTTNTLASKTDAKTQQLTYQYDSYNRLTSVTWANAVGGAQVLRTYYYDTNPLDSTGFSQNIAGRLAAVKYPAQLYVPIVNGVSLPGQPGAQLNEMYSYTGTAANGTGLPSVKRLQVNEPANATIGSHNYSGTATANLDTKFTYNTEGKMISMSYPATGLSNAPVAGPSYNYSYDSMYRLSGMTISGGGTMVSGVSYNAANQLLTINYGTAETRTYNALNQLVTLSAQNGATTVENLTYNYPSGANNGKLSSMYNAVSGETITYTYDSLNRIATASDCALSGGCTQAQLQWAELYGFDSFGNLLSKTMTAGSGAPSLSQAVHTSNNQIVGGSYDANGNTTFTNNGAVGYTLGYDAENRLSGSSANGQSTLYAYDAQNRRNWIWSGTEDVSGNQINYTVNAYTPGGQKVGAYTLAPSYNQTLSQFVMSVTATSNDTYFGSRRLAVMDQLGSVVRATAPVVSYYPWGEAKGTSNPQDTWNFATYWQDSTTGLDYANNRYYASIGGRFMTPDRSGQAQNPSNPQSWNNYAYVLGDPVNSTDPTGLNDCEDGWDCGGGEGPPNDPTNAPGNGENSGSGGGGGKPKPCGPNDPENVTLTPAQKALLGTTAYSSLSSAQQIVFLTDTADAAALGINLAGLTVSAIDVAGTIGSNGQKESQTELNLSGSGAAVAGLTNSLGANFSSWPSSLMVGSPHSGFTGNFRQNTPTWSMQINTNASGAQIDIDPYNPNSGAFLGHWWDVARNKLTGGDTNYANAASALGKRGVTVFNCP